VKENGVDVPKSAAAVRHSVKTAAVGCKRERQRRKYAVCVQVFAGHKVQLEQPPVQMASHSETSPESTGRDVATFIAQYSR
jgi:hypothetical protein